MGEAILIVDTIGFCRFSSHYSIRNSDLLINFTLSLLLAIFPKTEDGNHCIPIEYQ